MAAASSSLSASADKDAALKEFLEAYAEERAAQAR